MPLPDELFPAWCRDLRAPAPLTQEFPDDALLEALWGQFSQLYDRVVTANQTTNLTRITEPEAFAYRHLLDSLLPTPWIPSGSRVADIGSGAGFPALPLALARPDIQLTAIESVGKKARFIQETAQAMGLGSRLSVLAERCESLAHQPAHREQYDVVTARAVAALPTLLEWCLPLVKPGGVFLALKGPGIAEELAASQYALEVLQGEVTQIVKTEGLPQLHGSVLVVIQKTGKTPKQYPRGQGKPSKNPL
jgi:16S rRNA (guanine(527)-N(7))-methyltransferase RsmG